MKYESKFSVDDNGWLVRDERFERIIKCGMPANGENNDRDRGVYLPEVRRESRLTQSMPVRNFIFTVPVVLAKL